jgi:uncharacterized membrane protein YraQ (UPF0718 family)
MTTETWKKEGTWLALLAGVFLLCFWLPIDSPRFENAIDEALRLVRWYAREHVILCLLPAFFIAGAITVFLSQQATLKYLGPKANKIIAYGVASVSGTVLSVCSCTVLPLFAGIYRMGAGIGPASAFLYSGPAINILAIVLTWRILGFELGLARAIGAIVFGVVIGLAMHVIFRKSEKNAKNPTVDLDGDDDVEPWPRTAALFAAMIGVLVFANWGKPEAQEGVWWTIYSAKWPLTGAFAAALGVILVLWRQVAWWRMLLAALPVVVLSIALPDQKLIIVSAGVIGLSLLLGTGTSEHRDWLGSSWTFTKQIMPLLFAGVLVAGALLGRPGHEGLIPSQWVADLVGGNSVWANLFASVVGAFMYFATLTEVPIVEGLIGGGMGKGPALALLLAGPALSLPNMIVIRSIMGAKRTLVFITLVVVMATVSGMIYGAIAS